MAPSPPSSANTRPDEKVLQSSSDSESDPKADGVRGFDFGTGEKTQGADALGQYAEKRVLTEDDVYDELGYNFSSLKKWTILSVIFAVQVSMVRFAGTMKSLTRVKAYIKLIELQHVPLLQ